MNIDLMAAIIGLCLNDRNNQNINLFMLE